MKDPERQPQKKEGVGKEALTRQRKRERAASCRVLMSDEVIFYTPCSDRGMLSEPQPREVRADRPCTSHGSKLDTCSIPRP